MGFNARKQELKGLDISITTKIIPLASDDIAKAICDIAEKEGVTEIVIGSRGKNALSRLILGSVSEKVLVNAKCPTLIVG